MAGILSQVRLKAHQLFNSSADLSGSSDDREEGIGRYCTGGFHPVRLGEVYASKYQVLRKLGYGQYSTVWLVRNLEDGKFWAMKVLSAECYGAGSDIFELKILQHLRTRGSSHPGSHHITMLEDSFEHEGPHGTHVCLIFKVMGESMSTFQKSFPNASIPSPLVQHFTTQLLQAIACAHDCDVVHTDIQQGNIMIRNPDESALTKYLEDKYAGSIEVPEHSQDYQIIESKGLRNHYMPKAHGFNLMTLEVCLGDWGVASWKDDHLSETIQPLLLRAPEVILETPWGPSVDIWNLGALLPELMFGQNMFSGQDSGRYTTKGHLAEMNALLGPFPHALLSAAMLSGAKDLFDNHGDIRRYRLSKVMPLKNRFKSLGDDEAPTFEAFIKVLLELDPQGRRRAGDLFDEPWILHEYTQSIAAEKVS